MKKRLKYPLFLQVICLLFSSCVGKMNKDSNKTYSLQPDEKLIEIPIDNNTNCYSMSMFSYISPDSIPYLSYENEQTNELNFYRLDSCKLSHKIKIAKEGPEAVGRSFGHMIIDPDNILLFTQFKIFKVNRDGIIVEKYDLITDDQINLCHPPTSKIFAPMIVLDSCIYLYQALIHSDTPYDGYALEKYPLCIKVDMQTKLVEKLSLTYPRLWETENENGIFTCSRDYDGSNFVFSFFGSNSIHVTNDNKTFKEYPCKSQYISNKIKSSNAPDIKTIRKETIENAMYGNIIYDKYRNVYYRFFHLACELSKQDNISDLIKTGKKFSIMILDKDFQIIGETLFPENTYIPYMFFVQEDGLYISENNFQNPEFNENVLKFRRMTLTETGDN